MNKTDSNRHTSVRDPDRRRTVPPPRTGAGTTRVQYLRPTKCTSRARRRQDDTVPGAHFG